MFSLKEKLEIGFHIILMAGSLGNVFLGQYDVATYYIALLIYAKN